MAIDWDSHREARLAEDIAFLREAGARDEEIESRLNINLKSIARAEQRARQKDSA